MKKEAWVVAVDMGYGHQRAAYPLKDIAYDRIINANSDKMISEEEKRTWNLSRLFYEWVSRATEWPIIGKFLFYLFNQTQKIDPYYPRQSETKAGFKEMYIEKEIKKGLGKSLISYVKTKNIPFITTFYIPALVANYHELPKIYCVVTDTDISRVWAPVNIKNNRITYLSPCQHATNRLLSYGIKQDKIIMTGFPLPKECIGQNSEITKKSLAKRLINLDPNKEFLKRNERSINSELKGFNIKNKPKSPTLAFLVGGAGAQKEIGAKLIKSLKDKIKDKSIRLILVAGTHLDIKQYFEEQAKQAGLEKCLGKSLVLLAELNKKDYFSAFNKILNETDILWTKPSELSFYAALGLPLIIAPPIGDHEGWNRKWLLEMGAGLNQENPDYSLEWLNEWLSDGRLARCAWEGYLNAPRMGTYEIEKVVFKN